MEATTTARQAYNNLLKLEEIQIDKILNNATMDKENLSLDQITKRLDKLKKQQAALLGLNCQNQDKDTLNEYYQNKITEYKDLQEAAIKNQEVKDPIIISNQPE